MIQLFMWGTPNGYKVSIMLEETGLPYKVRPVDIGKGEQFAAEFLKISPNNKIPAIIDVDGPGGEPISLFESGAILLYLAEKTGQFLPQDFRWAVLDQCWVKRIISDITQRRAIRIPSIGTRKNRRVSMESWTAD